MATEDREEEVRALNAGACPVVEAVEEVGTAWRLNVVHELRGGEKRFNDLKRAVGARSKTLSEALDALREAGVVEKRMEEASPVAVYYSLTPKGEALLPALDELAAWGEEWVEGADEAYEGFLQAAAQTGD
jgi:DNA-binding HxlR family transcriptional regulator